MYKALILDFDGVVIDSEPIHHSVMEETFKQYRLNITKEIHQRFVGTNARFMIRTLITEHNLKGDVEEIFQLGEKLLFNKLKESVPIIKGIKELIKKAKRQRLKLGIASGGHRKYLFHVLDHEKLTHYFDAVVGSEDYTNPKPHPEPYLTCAKRIEAEPKECIVIEDSYSGSRSAKAAGMFVIGFQNPNSGNQDLSAADRIVQSINEIEIKSPN